MFISNAVRAHFYSGYIFNYEMFISNVVLVIFNYDMFISNAARYVECHVEDPSATPTTL